uniref:Saposin B-type domain-containing protein n=1 Tax=Chromera velia CCMP2878 TaxID=1169474 RepID=A0A0G4FXK6_9ALVE|eukprot:Cvel_3879.t1-p1 / transcript=Cvel_3879.t1 / gene=Cvel_3879 / organism=Chromera_velia_CCMP2878 / gene_product=hypothetical protein / transcript_product=hypothetical protein / location=Cvel_scaffold164:36042-36974(-) / protein_length=218 / sequence_SO=supercontig / SO=protein_coding / is_pseudo=false
MPETISRSLVFVSAILFGMQLSLVLGQDCVECTKLVHTEFMVEAEEIARASQEICGAGSAIDFLKKELDSLRTFVQQQTTCEKNGCDETGVLAVYASGLKNPVCERLACPGCTLHVQNELAQRIRDTVHADEEKYRTMCVSTADFKYFFETTILQDLQDAEVCQKCSGEGHERSTSHFISQELFPLLCSKGKSLALSEQQEPQYEEKREGARAVLLEA